MRKKELFDQIISSLTGSGLTILLGVLSVALSAKILGADGRGELAILMTIPLMAAGVVGFGSGYSSVHFTVLDNAAAFRNWEKALIINLLTVPLILIIGIIYFLLTGITSFLGANIGVLLLITFAAAIYSSTWGVHLGLRRFGPYNIKKTIPQFLYLISILGAYFYRDAVYVAIAYSILLIIYSGFEYNSGKKIFRKKINIQSMSTKSFFSYGLNSFLPSIPQTISQRIDLLVGISVFDHKLIGLYAVSASIGQLFQGLNSSLGNILLAKDKESSGKISYIFFWRFVKIVFIVNLAALGLFYLVGGVAIEFILGKDFVEIKSIALVLIISGGLSGINSILYDGFRASSLQSIPLYSEILSLALKGMLITYFAINGVILMEDLAAAVLFGATLSFVYCIINLIKMNSHEKIY